MNTYQVGDRVRITATFANTTGVATDPTTITILVRNRSDGTLWTYIYSSSITKSGTGVFYADHDVDREGVHDYRAVGTGAVHTAGEASFKVEDSQFF